MRQQRFADYPDKFTDVRELSSGVTFLLRDYCFSLSTA